MPRIWSETIAAHRDAVRDATLDAAAALVDERGLTGLTMSEIARRSGIGRATLYKYFPDVESILAAWHERRVSEHLRQLAAVSAATGRPSGSRRSCEPMLPSRASGTAMAASCRRRCTGASTSPAPIRTWPSSSPR